MIAAVIPALNEEKSIGILLNKVLQLPIDIIIPVVNGCTDNTWQIVNYFTQVAKQSDKIVPLYFKEPLGIDVPRALGAKKAIDLGATGIVFIDGDMCGKIDEGVTQIVQSLRTQEVDLALTDCYGPINIELISDPLASLVISYRRKLNEALGYYRSIGIASPSHGPHGISSKFINIIGYLPLAIPPILLTLARLYNQNIKIVATIPHDELGSRLKDSIHAFNIAQTIIGDCLEALALYQNRPSTRQSPGSQIYLGYHCQRRWDLLKKYLNDIYF